MKKSKDKKGMVAFKIDLQKAYDKVDWRFLRYMLCKFSFPLAIVKLVMLCFFLFALYFMEQGKISSVCFDQRSKARGPDVTLFVHSLHGRLECFDSFQGG